MKEKGFDCKRRGCAIRITWRLKAREHLGENQAGDMKRKIEKKEDREKTERRNEQAGEYKKEN